MVYCKVVARDMKDKMSVWETGVPVENWKDARDMVAQTLTDAGESPRVILVRIK
jgi:hypothetical protein